MRTIFATFNIVFAEARHNLVARLIDTHRLKAAASQSAQAITAYLHYARENRADPARAIGDRTQPRPRQRWPHDPKAKAPSRPRT